MRQSPYRGAVRLLLPALLLAAGASAQQAPPPVPAGAGRVVGRLVQPAHSTTTLAGVEVLLYALDRGGAAGLAVTSTDADGRFRFEGVSNDPGVVYIVGTRAGDVPFGERFTFGAGELEHRVELLLSDVVSDGARERRGAVDVRLDRGCTHLRVTQVQELTNDGDAVIFVPESLRKSSPPLLEAKLPPGAVAFESLLGEESLTRDGDTVRFWGPLYSGSREIEFGYGLPLDTGALALEFPSGATELRVLAPEGVIGASSETLEHAPVRELDGQSYATLRAGSVAPGRRVDLALSLDPSRPAALRTPQAELWLELDDAALEVDERIEVEVQGSGLALSPASPWLCIPLPPEAQSLRLSKETAHAGLYRDPSGTLAIHGPLAAGTSELSVRYQLPARPEGAVLRRSFDRELPLLHVLVADTGIVAQSDRMHRRRSVRADDRLFLHYEAFAVEPDEVVELDLRRTPPSRATPRWATAGVVALVALGAVSFLMAPLRSPEPAPAQEETEGDSLASERDAIRRSLADLDHDLETGKLSAEDHAALRAELRARAAKLLLAAREPAPAPPTPPPSPAPPTCGSCGATPRPDDRFCSRCGADLTRNRNAS